MYVTDLDNNNTKIRVLKFWVRGLVMSAFLRGWNCVFGCRDICYMRLALTVANTFNEARSEICAFY